MKNEWTQEPHTTVRWALVEALRASDNASTVDYWDVVTENLIRELKLRQEWAAILADRQTENGPFYEKSSIAPTKEAVESYIARAYMQPDRWEPQQRLVSDWKRVDSDE